MWRTIHYMSVVSFGAALWHGVQLGTDSREPWLLGTYLLTQGELTLGANGVPAAGTYFIAVGLRRQSPMCVPSM